ncbi:MAG: helix-turn-helix transcriptional regulator [Erysipelothrix sp.]|nr:helix-turn-helix transcriptional regulator [Erysipelothrix sp.]
MNNDLSKKIHDLRVLNNDSQEDLAQKINVSRQAISKWETGLSNPDFNTLKQLAKLYGKDMSYFFEESKQEVTSLFILDKPYFKLLVVVLCIVITMLAGSLSLIISVPYLISNIQQRNKLWSFVFLFLVFMGIYLLLIVLFPGLLPYSIGYEKL